jgi:hypothetical protein
MTNLETLLLPKDFHSLPPLVRRHTIQKLGASWLDARATETCRDELAVDTEHQNRVKEARESREAVARALAELDREENEAHNERGALSVAGGDCSQLDKRICAIVDKKARLKDELAARNRIVAELSPQASKVHLQFVSARCAAAATIVSELGAEAECARQECDIRVALLGVAKMRLDQYNEGLRLARERSAQPSLSEI